MQMRHEVDVLIIGLGPVGATLANLLGRYGVDVVAIDHAPAIFHAPRAIALDDEALRILQLAGLPEGTFPTVAIPEVRMRSPLVGDFARASTAGQIGGHPRLVTFCQPELEAALQTRLREHASVRFARGLAATAIEQGPDSVKVTLRLGDGTSTTIDASYVVGCDGASSLVRKSVGLDFRGRTYAQDWLLADVRGLSAPIDHVEFFCDPARPYPRLR
jgi:3-(3-hydroxy-phenyl)propionate hydroxylase